MNIFKKAANWLTEFGNRKAPKANVQERVDEAPEVKKAPAKALKPYQVKQRHWDARLKAAMTRYGWLSYRWLVPQPGQRISKKARRVLNPDGTVKAYAKGVTFNQGRNAEKRGVGPRFVGVRHCRSVAKSWELVRTKRRERQQVLAA